MTHTPDEIKKGLERCARVGHCYECPYKEECLHSVDDANPMHMDVLAYTQQLEAERDAAIKDIEESQPCFACKNFNRNSGNCGGGKRCLRLAEIAERNGGTYKGKFFEWRGVQKEVT